MKKFLLSLAFISALCVNANAQTPNAIVCTGFDTASNSTSPLANITQCDFTTGPFGLAFAVATAEVQCGSPGMTVQLFIGAGPSPIGGANLNASISSGILNVTSGIDFFNPPHNIQVGQSVVGGGFVPVTITGLVSQTAAVTFSNGSASIGWTNTLVAGQAVHFTTTGSLPANFTPNTVYYVIPLGLSGSNVQVSATPDQGAIVTFTNGLASIGWTNTLVSGQAVYFQTSGSLPANFTQNTIYYVLATGLTSSTVQVAATPGGTPIVAGSAGGGVQTGYGNYGAPIVAGSAGSGVQTGNGNVGGVGTYTLSGSPPDTASEEMWSLSPIPGWATAITPLLHQTACSGQFFITTIAGAFTGSAKTKYWVDAAIATSDTSARATWNNGTITIFTY